VAKRKNVLLFLTDDHGVWANGCYGNSEVQTPTLDRLADKGVRFANTFTPTPVCSPARACLLTGHTASQVGIHDWLQEFDDEVGHRDWLQNQKTLFNFFHEAGYYTGLSGKWHLGQSHLTPSGADYHFGLPGWQGQHNHDYTYVKNGEDFTSSKNKSALITDHAIEFLENLPEEQPFFLNVGYIATHSPYHKEAHDSRLTDLYEEAKFNDIPPYSEHPWVKNEGFRYENPTEQDLRDHYIGYYAAVTEIDKNIERIMTTLDKAGLADDTVIIYTSDHGCTLGHHGFFGKGNSTRPLNMYEHSLRIPLIWSGANIQSGHVSNHNVTHYDTFQTLLEFVGIQPSSTLEYPGQSYLPMLSGQTQEWNETIYGEYGDLRMIRTNEYKLVIRYPDGPHDLFDLINDPDETTNLINQEDHKNTISDLRQQLDAFYSNFEDSQNSGINVKNLPRHNDHEAWRDGRRENRGLQVY
jgi:choline-sulfatase